MNAQGSHEKPALDATASLPSTTAATAAKRTKRDESSNVHERGEPCGDLLAETRAKIVAVVGEGLIEPVIRKRVGGNRRLTSFAIRQAVAAGELIREGGGKSGDPYRYRLPRRDEPSRKPPHLRTRPASGVDAAVALLARLSDHDVALLQAVAERILACVTREDVEASEDHRRSAGG